MLQIMRLGPRLVRAASGQVIRHGSPREGCRSIHSYVLVVVRNTPSRERVGHRRSNVTGTSFCFKTRGYLCAGGNIHVGCLVACGHVGPFFGWRKGRAVHQNFILDFNGNRRSPAESKRLRGAVIGRELDLFYEFIGLFQGRCFLLAGKKTHLGNKQEQEEQMLFHSEKRFKNKRMWVWHTEGGMR